PPRPAPVPPHAAATALTSRLRTYAAHDDPATAVANAIALIVGWNGPFYPLYVVALAGAGGGPAVALTALSTPFFLAIPALARRSSRAGRLALPLIGTANTLWCIKLLGPACGLQLFLLPCVMLAALLHRRSERPLLVLAAAGAVAAYALPERVLGAALIPLHAEVTSRLAALNEASVLALTVVIAWQVAALLRRDR
ncbi:MAG: hypothetical protein J0H19_16420, partial [Rhodospirillales bacterium]|nr:hypothetical protein [Rhodospirillales bacterium]